MDRYAAERIRGFGPSVFIEMSRLAQQHQAINLGQGFPDFAGPDFVKNAAKAAIDADLNQYAPSHGTPRLRGAIAATFERQTGLAVDVDTGITVTSGATEAIYDAIQAFLNPGNEIIFFEPFYDSYHASTVMANAVPRPIRLHPPDWSFDRDELRAAFNARTRVLLLNTPHNPTGKVFTRDELEFIAQLCIEHDVVVLSDEVYDRIVFNGAEHISIATLPGMWERTLTINSTGKTFSMTGWKIGYAVGPAPLNAALRAVHQFVTFASQTPFQDAMAAALEIAEESGYYEQLAADYDARRVAMTEAIEGAGFMVLPVSGAYFLMADPGERGFASDVEFCTWLIREAGVTTVPPSAFYEDPATAPMLARFCFAKKLETIAEAGARLRRIAAVSHAD
jgi:aspartate/methionine/tyrosine aminotransferase